MPVLHEAVSGGSAVRLNGACYLYDVETEIGRAITIPTSQKVPMSEVIALAEAHFEPSFNEDAIISITRREGWLKND